MLSSQPTSNRTSTVKVQLYALTNKINGFRKRHLVQVMSVRGQRAEGRRRVAEAEAKVEAEAEAEAEVKRR